MATSLLGCQLRNILFQQTRCGFVVNQCRQVNTGDWMKSNGAIREGGGAFSKREEALEEMYFRKKEKELLQSLKSHHQEEISAQEKEIKRLQEKIEWHKEKLEDLKDHKSSDG
ncbi:hypothetical protein chiPu_0015210 [Chiloscyllium punctatum]|uniref:ATPase inhibitor, mitochondrial n=1 Tax=Chiloscyllium punctatum TaxID=137246 RepID=A0A401T226_CHIPU|nr:hypothetical protein [Chiloscyllium punctatum]